MKKRLIALGLAAAMTFSTVVPAFANWGGVGDLDGLVVPDQEFAGTLPTNANLNFAIDPFGHLEGFEVGDVVDIEDMNNQVVFDYEAQTLMRAHNASPLAGVLTTTFQLRNNAGDGAPVGVVPVATEAAVAGPTITAPNVLFWVQPSSSALETATANFVGAARAFPILGASAATLTFHLAGTEHQLEAATVNAQGQPQTLRWGRVNANEVNGVGFQVGGIFNPVADWTVDTLQVSLRATYAWSAVTATAANLDVNYYTWDHDNDPATDPVPLAHGLLAAGSVVIGTATITAPPAAAGLIEIPAAAVTLEADASFNTAGSLLTINATGFEFPAADITVAGRSTVTGNVANIGTATITRVNATQITVGFTAGWSNGGNNQQAGQPSVFVITAGNYTITVEKPNAGVSVVGNVIVERT